MTALFFGQRWDAPAVDDATQVATPVGQPCYSCSEPIVDGDRGFLRSIIRGRSDKDGQWIADTRPVHTECEMLSVMGHALGVCSCTDWDTSSRAAGRELLARLNAARATQGHGPL